jgi:hypothetical protein
LALDDIENIEGQFSAQIEAEESVDIINKQYVDLAPNTTYTLSAWLKTENVTGEGAQVYPYDFDDSNPPSNLIWVTGTTDWTQYTMQFTTGANPSEATINFRIKDGSGEAWFDDVQLVETGP